jgi:TatD DNase family protein
MVQRIAGFPDVSVSVGVHPTACPSHEPTVAELVHLARHPKVVAIGETGLDYYHGTGGKARQQERFRVHIAAAKASGKPLIVHTRSAREDTLRILAEEQADTVGGVFHCFSEDWDTAMRAMALNFFISFSGLVTFSKAKQIQAVAKRIPIERMLVETDSPYLAPVPHRGQSNQPAWVRYIAESIATLRGESVARIAEITTANYGKLFGGISLDLPT